MDAMSDAERKARQRAGYTNIYVEVQLPELRAALMAAGVHHRRPDRRHGSDHAVSALERQRVANRYLK